MATTSFFYGGSSAPSQNNIDQLIDDLNTKIQAADEAKVAAELAAEQAAISASSAINVESNLSALAALAQDSLNQANQAVIDAQVVLATALEAIESSTASVELAEAWATLLGSTVDGVEYSSKYYAQASNTSAGQASTSASASTTSASNASTSASTASTQASNAVGSASTATTQAGIATTQAGIATTKADTATTQAGIATTKADTATTQAGIATTQAGIATTQASNASTSESNASASASAALTSENNASTSATNASTSESNADTSALLAEDWATKTTGTVDGSEYSAKYYAELTATNLNDKANSDGSNATGTWDINISGGSVEATNFSASGTATFTSNEAVKIPVGSTAQRPTPSAGMLRFNSTSGEFEGYSTDWASVGGSAITNDTATSTDVYPLFANATSGTAANVYTSNSKLLYKPSTGEFKADALVAQNGIVVNSATVTANYTIPTGSNAMSAGPITIDDGISVTVPTGSNWVVL